MKTCPRCKMIKDFKKFSKDKYRKDGFYSICKECDKIQSRLYYLENKEKIISKQQERYTKNRERRQEYSRVRYLKQKEAGKLPVEKIRKHTKHGKLSGKLNKRLVRFITARNQNYYRDLFGCTVGELRAHLEKQFLEGMTWENWRKDWQIDHIRPYSLFDLSNEKDVLEVSHYTNLRPLWSHLNVRRPHPKKSWPEDQIDRVVNDGEKLVLEK